MSRSKKLAELAALIHEDDERRAKWIDRRGIAMAVPGMVPFRLEDPVVCGYCGCWVAIDYAAKHRERCSESKAE